MEKYLVISYDDDQQQPYFDHMLAANRDHAIILMEQARPDALPVDALTVSDLRKMAIDLDNASESEIRDGMARTACSAEGG